MTAKTLEEAKKRVLKELKRQKLIDIMRNGTIIYYMDQDCLSFGIDLALKEGVEIAENNYGEMIANLNKELLRRDEIIKHLGKLRPKYNELVVDAKKLDDTIGFIEEQARQQEREERLKDMGNLIGYTRLQERLERFAEICKELKEENPRHNQPSQSGQKGSRGAKG